MNKKFVISTCFFVMCMGWLIVADSAKGEEINISGTVNEYFQVETDSGDLYDIAYTELGDELSQLVGAKVDVTGMVEESEGEKVITVMRYEILKEATPLPGSEQQKIEQKLPMPDKTITPEKKKKETH
ncbi:MAG: hypothetical protein V1753_10795 [Pseudomonadota bacterium]